MLIFNRHFFIYFTGVLTIYKKIIKKRFTKMEKYGNIKPDFKIATLNSKKLKIHIIFYQQIFKKQKIKIKESEIYACVIIAKEIR